MRVQIYCKSFLAKALQLMKITSNENYSQTKLLQYLISS